MKPALKHDLCLCSFIHMYSADLILEFAATNAVLTILESIWDIINNILSISPGDSQQIAGCASHGEINW